MRAFLYSFLINHTTSLPRCVVALLRTIQIAPQSYRPSNEKVVEPSGRGAKHDLLEDETRPGRYESVENTDDDAQQTEQPTDDTRVTTMTLGGIGTLFREMEHRFMRSGAETI